MPSGGMRSTRHAKAGGLGGSLGSAIRHERFDKVGYKMAR